MRSTSALRSPTARAITPRRYACSKRASRFGADSASRSTSPRRCRRFRWSGLHVGDVEGARAGEDEAVRIFRSIDDRIGEAIGLLHLGQIFTYAGDHAEARAHLEQCLAIAREIRHLEIEGECERMLGELALEASDVEGAYARFECALRICREAEDKRDEAVALWWMGKTDLARGDDESARVKFRGRAARIRGLRDARGGARLPRGPCAPSASVGTRRPRGVAVRGDRRRAGEARAQALAAQRPAVGREPGRCASRARPGGLRRRVVRRQDVVDRRGDTRRFSDGSGRAGLTFSPSCGAASAPRPPARQAAMPASRVRERARRARTDPGAPCRAGSETCSRQALGY